MFRIERPPQLITLNYKYSEDTFILVKIEDVDAVIIILLFRIFFTNVNMNWNFGRIWD